MPSPVRMCPVSQVKASRYRGQQSLKDRTLPTTRLHLPHLCSVIFILSTQQGSSAAKAKQIQQKHPTTPNTAAEAPLPASHRLSTRVNPTCAQCGHVMLTGCRPRSDKSLLLLLVLLVFVLLLLSAGGADGVAAVPEPDEEGAGMV